MEHFWKFRERVYRGLPEDSPLYIVRRTPNTLDADSVEVFCTSCWQNHTHGVPPVSRSLDFPEHRAAHCRNFPNFKVYGYNYSDYYIADPPASEKFVIPPKSLAFESKIARACYDSRFLDYMSESDIRDPDKKQPMAWFHKKEQVCRTRYCGTDLFGVEFIKTKYDLFVSVGMFKENSTEMISSSHRETVFSRKEINRFIKLVGLPEHIRSSNAKEFKKVNKERKRLKKIAKDSLKTLV